MQNCNENDTAHLFNGCCVKGKILKNMFCTGRSRIDSEMINLLITDRLVWIKSFTKAKSLEFSGQNITDFLYIY